jgi:putative phage-type endonuclease
MATRKYLVLREAFEQSLNRFIKDLGLKSNDLKDPKVINELGVYTEMTLTEIFSSKEILKFDFEQAVKESIQKRYFYDDPVYSEMDLDNIDKTLSILNNHPTHAQRSLEWYSFRQGRVTASDVAKAIGKSGDKSRWSLVYQKALSLEDYIADQKGFSLDSKVAIRHGKCFESVAVELYERRNKVKVKEYGCLPHIFIDHLAASPDGIVYSRDTNPNYHGRMLEIKCPYSRTINGIIKMEYYMQIQLQLDVCELEYCDFLECDIRLYDNLTDFLNDSDSNDIEKSYSKRANGNEKGILWEYKMFDQSSVSYKYCPVGLTNQEIKEWMKKVKEDAKSMMDLDFSIFRYWYLEEYNVVLVKREPEYFEEIKTEIANFWALVQHYKRNGLDPLKEKLGMLPRKPSGLDSFLENGSGDNRLGENGSPTDNFKDDLDNIDFIDFDKPQEDKPQEDKLQEDKGWVLKKRKRVEDNLEFLDLPDEESEKGLVIEITETKITTMNTVAKAKTVKQFKSLTVIKPE